MKEEIEKEAKLASQITFLDILLTGKADPEKVKAEVKRLRARK